MKKTGKMILAGAVSLTAAAGVLADDLPNYVVTPLGDLPGGDFFSRAFDINDKGMIVGSSKSLTDDIRQEAVRWKPGSTEPEMLSGVGDFDFSRAQTVNNDGLVGGYRDNIGETQRAWLWDANNGLDFFLDDVNDPDISFSRMGQVTNVGKVVGWLRFSDLDSGTRGYVYDIDSETRMILDPIGPDGNQSLGQTMNDFQLVVGSASELPDRERPFRDAVAWSTGLTMPNLLPGLGAFSGYEDTGAVHVTDDGVIVGGAGNRDLDNTLYAQNENWIWSPSTQLGESMGTLGDLEWTKVGDINDDATMAVGFGYADGQHKSEFLADHVGAIWTPDMGWVDVNDLLVNNTDYHIAELAGMNAAGQIVGTAINPDGDVEAVLLSPGCLTLTLGDLVAGEKANVRVTRGTPGERTVVVWGFGGEPSEFFDVKNWCATFGFDVRLKGKTIRVMASGFFNSQGVFEREVFVQKGQGLTLLFQAAERGTCPDECMSPVVEATVQ